MDQVSSMPRSAIPDKSRPRILYISGADPQDRRLWSGIPYSILNSLRAHCGEVEVLIAEYPRRSILNRGMTRILRTLTHTEWMVHNGSGVARKVAKSLKQAVRQSNPDIVLSVAGSEFVAYLETDRPILHVSDATAVLLNKNYRFATPLAKRAAFDVQHVEKKALEKSAASVFASQWAAESAISDYGINQARVHVLPFGANIQGELPRIESKNQFDRCNLLFLGVDWERKGGDLAVSTLHALRRLGINAQLTVCGCTPVGTIGTSIKVVPFLNKNIAGDVGRLERLMKESHFLLLPTRAECYGIVFCEASAYGLPSIATNVGGVSTAVRQGENGYLLPLSADANEYAHLIAKVWSDRKGYAVLRQSSRARYDALLNWDVWGRSLAGIIKTILHGA